MAVLLPTHPHTSQSAWPKKTPTLWHNNLWHHHHPWDCDLKHYHALNNPHDITSLASPYLQAQIHFFLSYIAMAKYILVKTQEDLKTLGDSTWKKHRNSVKLPWHHNFEEKNWSGCFGWSELPEWLKWLGWSDSWVGQGGQEQGHFVWNSKVAVSGSERLSKF